MTPKKLNILGYVIRGVALLLLLIAFFLLFEMVEFEYSNYISANGYGEGSYIAREGNFFYRMKTKYRIGESIAHEILTLISFALTFSYFVLTFLVKFFRKIYFCVIPVALIPLLIRFKIGWPSSFTISESFSSNTNSTVSRSVDLWVDYSKSVVLVCFALAAMLTISIIELVYAIKEKRKAERMEQYSTFAINSEFDAKIDRLKKFKELFDSGIITQEEFEAKKRELVDL